ncbi:hypothetical protein [Agromyces larvae]|uniref:Uncharacterized protein n=1 Tax=Agromyces larvae TaxID=2929802 RepID=A0ABY4BUK3_9MICO|nr:hypothetical protein [Agromyces larvae]UOE42897.1 hypothetical protein MTO99_11935 [Agromyces larvae]
MSDLSPGPFTPEPDPTDLDGPGSGARFGDATALPNDDTTAAGAESGTQTSDASVPDDAGGTALEGADPTPHVEADILPDDPEAQNPQRA